MIYFALKIMEAWRWDGEKPFNESRQIALAGFCGRSCGYLQLFEDEESVKNAIRDFYKDADYFEIEL